MNSLNYILLSKLPSLYRVTVSYLLHAAAQIGFSTSTASATDLVLERFLHPVNSRRTFLLLTLSTSCITP